MKNFGLLSLLLCLSISTVYSQAPVVPAPTPSCASSDVISMFSESYTDVLVDTWQTVWSSGTLADITVAGNPTKEYTNLDFVGIETVTNQIDASGMTHFHLDFWTPNMTELRIKIVDFGADCAFGGGDDTEHEIVIPTPTQMQWVSLEVPLSDFTNLTSTTKISQLIISGFPSGGGTVYVDNVFFSTGCVGMMPTTVPTAPTCAAGDVISMFSDAYTDVPVDTWQTVWSSGTLADLTIAGNPVKEYTNLDFVGIETVTNQIDASGMTHFHLDFWTPNMTELRIKIVDFGPDCAFGGGDDTEHEIVIPTPAQGQWVSLEIPLSDFTGLTNTTKISQLIISGFPSGGGTVYVDNVFFSTGCVGMMPTTVPTAPTCAAADVISMFSDAYTDVPVDTWQTVWSSGTLADLTIAGNPVKEYTNLDFVGIETVSSQIDASGMTHFHLDFWTPNMTELRIKIVDFGPDCAFGGGDDTEHEIVIPTPAQGQWVSLEIPLSDFTGLTNTTKISQLIISGFPTGGGTVYIDNVYFSSGCVIAMPTTVPAAPTCAGADVISMFSDAYTDVPVDTWQTVWSNATFMDVTIAGNPVKQYTNLDFVGIETVSSQIDASGMTHFHLDFWTPNMTELRIKIVDFGPDCVFGGGDDTEHEIVIPTPAQNQWVSLEIPLSDFVGLTNTTKISQLIISGFPTGGGTIYVDNVYFSTGCVVPAPTTVPAAPTCPAANVISMFSDTYTDVPVDTWQTVWSSGTLADLTIAGNPVKQYTNLDFVGIETVTSQIDASGMTHFHLDFWTPNMTELRIKIVDFGPDCVFGGGDDTEHEIVISAPAQNQWVSLELPLSAFTGLTNTTKISQLIISGFPTGGGTIYIDNVYFSTGCVTPMPLEAAVCPPVCDPSGVISLFSDAYADVPVDTWATVWSSTTFSDVTVAGDPVKLYENLDFVGIETVANQIDATNMTNFHLDFWTPNMTEIRIKIVDFGPDCVFGGGDDTEHEIVITNPAQNEWVSVDLPLSAFTGLTNVTKISQLIISGFPTGTGTVYIDNVYFYGECNPIPACPQLVWSDEFDGTTLNTANWEAQLGDGSTLGLIGWGNSELQSYENDANNLDISGGTLKIIAQQENVVFNGTPYNYTSARLRTANLQDFTYGRFEASIKLPVGQGIWPAFWLLHTDGKYGPWPESGEIDIMEYLGQEPDNIFGTTHFGTNPPFNPQNNSMNLKDLCGTYDADFHEFAVEWDTDEIRWYVDDYLFFTQNPPDVAPYIWPYNQPFHIILNLAVGGTLPGPPDATTVFPQTMEVDYVRVYKGEFPHISGNSFVAYQAAGEVYDLGNVAAGSTITWNVPGSATLVSGQGTNQATIDWGTDPVCEVLSVTVDDGCDVYTIDLNVKVDIERVEVLDCVLENFDQPALITYNNSSGVFVDNVANPAPDAVNGSALVGEYTRDGASLFDNIQYSTAAITDADAFVTGGFTFFVDVYTSAPVGSTLLLQLENSATAIPTNYPVGRHSRYQAVTTVQNAWERLEFVYLDQPDPSVPTTAVDRIVLLFNPNSNTGDVFYFDNLEKYCTDARANCFDDMDISTTDPCNCTNPDNVTLPDGTFLFEDELIVDASALAGTPTVTLGANDGNFLDANGNPIPVGTVLTPIGGGLYSLQFYTAESTPSTITIDADGREQDYTTTSCMPCPFINPVPTMSEWGLFLFGLIMLNLGLVFLYQRKQALA